MVPLNQYCSNGKQIYVKLVCLNTSFIHYSVVDSATEGLLAIGLLCECNCDYLNY